MNIYEIIVGENSVWLVIEPLRFTDDDKQVNYICYYKFSRPTMFFYGQLLKLKNGIPIEFSSIEKAIDYSKNYFNKKILFKHPLNYKKEELEEILNIPIRIEYLDKNEKKETIGSIISFSVAHNPPNLPYDLQIKTIDDSIESINIFSIIEFNNL